MYFSRIEIASLKVVLSGAVGPDAIVSKESPTTSERIRLIKVAGYDASASWPPFSPDKCFLTELISWIVAPHFRSDSVKFCLSFSVVPVAGRGIRADPPPEIRQIIRSFSFAL